MTHLIMVDDVINIKEARKKVSMLFFALLSCFTTEVTLLRLRISNSFIEDPSQRADIVKKIHKIRQSKNRRFIMSEFRFACVTLMIVLAINHSDQSSIRSQSAEHQSIVKEHSPINIIRIKPVALESSKNNLDHQENRRKQKSSTETGLSESNGSASSVIVIKPVLSPISEYPAKKNSKKFWKKMMRRPKFLHDVKKGDNMSVSRVARVHLAPGAYPVFYGLAKTNGNFNKIKSITHSTNY